MPSSRLLRQGFLLILVWPFGFCSRNIIVLSSRPKEVEHLSVKLLTKRAVLIFVVLLIAGLAQGHLPGAYSSGATEPKNSWHGIVPLQSSLDDVARILGVEVDPPGAASSGPHRVEGGEVTFNFLTPSLAKIYRAPRSMVGKVFTIYFKPGQPPSKDELKLSPGFKRCVEQMTTATYYLINDAGVAYQFHQGNDRLETVIYQPSRAQVRSLAVNTECVF